MAAPQDHAVLGPDDFEVAFGESLSPFVIQQIQRYHFAYTTISSAEQEKLLIRIIDTLLDPQITQSGEHRLSQWESGWGENLQGLQNNPGDSAQIVPKYFNKFGAVRWQGRLVKPVSEKFEFHSLAIILDWLFDKYCRNAQAIYEFGCGTGHNLLHLREINPHATLWGLDWAASSQDILAQMVKDQLCTNIYGHRFNYFFPDNQFKLMSDSVVYTVASLEQIGDRWQPFVDYILAQKPAICVHVEPIAELLNENILLDNLSCKYFRKRNYLYGFLAGLQELERRGKAKIHRTQRTGIGSLFIEGYSVVVWSPI